jgi:hypothetical protein
VAVYFEKTGRDLRRVRRGRSETGEKRVAEKKRGKKGTKNAN